MRRSEKQQERAEDSTDEAGDQERQQHSPRNIEAVAVGAAAGSHARPKGKRVGGIGRNRGHADKEQRRKGDKTASPRNGIQGTAQDACAEKEDAVIESQG